MISLHKPIELWIGSYCGLNPKPQKGLSSHKPDYALGAMFSYSAFHVFLLAVYWYGKGHTPLITVG